MKKIKTLRHIQSILYTVWNFDNPSINTEGSSNVVVPHKTAFYMLCVCKTETTPAGVASS